jgi:ribonucleoside-diphosphate reductase alpha chain
MPDGTKKDYQVEDHAYRLYRELGGDVKNLPEYFKHALEISVNGHVLMVNAVKNHVDAAISKTINVPADYPFSDFSEVYMQAWKLGLKGITTYRPSGVRGSVLSVTEPVKAKEEGSAATLAVVTEAPVIKLRDADRRMILSKQVNPALESLRWPSRPVLPKGTSAWVSDAIEVGETSFVAVVSDVDSRPFEVWVTGAMPPRGLSALAKMLSIDMHTEDSTWAQRKLEILKKTNGATIEIVDPATGEKVIVPSIVSALSKLVQYRYEELGHVKKRPKQSPLLDALISPQEPKTNPDGTMGWVCDVNNATTGDDFVLMLKELELPDGKTRPYSVWCAGKYPRAFDGLLKVLSLDMRVVDVAWIAMKLRKLAKYGESQGDFMARVPGSPKMVAYPSTESYIAALMIHRYNMLGILDEKGYPLEASGIMDKEGIKVEAKPVDASGAACPECGNHTLIKKDGCTFCNSCGYIGSCG